MEIFQEIEIFDDMEIFQGIVNFQDKETILDMEIIVQPWVEENIYCQDYNQYPYAHQ